MFKKNIFSDWFAISLIMPVTWDTYLSRGQSFIVPYIERFLSLENFRNVLQLAVEEEELKPAQKAIIWARWTYFYIKVRQIIFCINSKKKRIHSKNLILSAYWQPQGHLYLRKNFEWRDWKV